MNDDILVDSWKEKACLNIPSSGTQSWSDLDLAL